VNTGGEEPQEKNRCQSRGNGKAIIVSEGQDTGWGRQKESCGKRLEDAWFRQNEMREKGRRIRVTMERGVETIRKKQKPKRRNKN